MRRVPAVRACSVRHPAALACAPIDSLRETQHTAARRSQKPKFTDRGEKRRLVWAGALDVDAALKAICIRGKDRDHEQLHRGHYEDSVQVVQSASNNDEYINSALSTAINEVLHDRQLMDCLARRDGGTTAGAGT